MRMGADRRVELISPSVIAYLKLQRAAPRGRVIAPVNDRVMPWRMRDILWGKLSEQDHENWKKEW